jgi:hypothetical protein
MTCSIKSISTVILQNEPLESSSLRLIFFLMLWACRVVQSIRVRALVCRLLKAPHYECETHPRCYKNKTKHKTQKLSKYTTMDDMVQEINFHNITKQTSRNTIGRLIFFLMLWTYIISSNTSGVEYFSFFFCQLLNPSRSVLIYRLLKAWHHQRETHFRHHTKEPSGYTTIEDDMIHETKFYYKGRFTPRGRANSMCKRLEILTCDW